MFGPLGDGGPEGHAGSLRGFGEASCCSSRQRDAQNTKKVPARSPPKPPDIVPVITDCARTHHAHITHTHLQSEAPQTPEQEPQKSSGPIFQQQQQQQYTKAIVLIRRIVNKGTKVTSDTENRHIDITAERSRIFIGAMGPPGAGRLGASETSFMHISICVFIGCRSLVPKSALAASGVQGPRKPRTKSFQHTARSPHRPALNLFSLTG